MPFQTRVYTVGDELDRLDDRLDELADAAAEAEDADEREQYATEGAIAEAKYNGLQWLADEHGPDATVELAGLNKGEQARVHDRAEAAAETVVGVGETGTDGAKTIFRCAMGLVDAPFIPEGAGFEQRVPVVREELPVELCRWVEDEVNDLTTVGEGNSQTFAERLAARTPDADE
jgi:hypothetical protein